MALKQILAVAMLATATLIGSGCNKKVNPTKGPATNNTTKTTDEPDATPVKTTPVPVVVKKTTPKFITVNDAVAKKSVDGRLYYDLEGKRYWKNYKDGKYYLFNKSMSSDPDYKPRG